MDGTFFPIQSDQLPTLWVQNNVWEYLLNAAAPGASRHSLGLERLPDASFGQHIHVELASGARYELFFDPESHRLCACQLLVHYPGSPKLKTTTYLYTVYQHRNGFWEPCVWRKFVGDEFYTSGQIQSIDDTIPAPIGIFQHPSNNTIPGPATLPMGAGPGGPSVMASVNHLKPQSMRIDLWQAISSVTPEIKYQAAEAGHYESVPFANRAASRPGSSVIPSGTYGYRTPPVSDERQADGTTLYTFDSIAIGSATVEHFTAADLYQNPGPYEDPDHIGGVLGQNILGYFQLTFDFPAKSLTLAPRGSPLPHGTPVPMVLNLGWPFVGLQLGDSAAEARLSTTEWETTLKASDIPVALRRQAYSVGAVKDAQGDDVTRYMVRVPTLLVGNVVAHDYPVYFLDPAAVLRSGSEQDSTLGLSFFRNLRLTIDYDQGKVVIASPANR